MVFWADKYLWNPKKSIPVMVVSTALTLCAMITHSAHYRDHKYSIFNSFKTGFDHDREFFLYKEPFLTTPTEESLEETFDFKIMFNGGVSPEEREYIAKYALDGFNEVNLYLSNFDEPIDALETLWFDDTIKRHSRLPEGTLVGASMNSRLGRMRVYTKPNQDRSSYNPIKPSRIIHELSHYWVYLLPEEEQKLLFKKWEEISCGEGNTEDVTFSFEHVDETDCERYIRNLATTSCYGAERGIRISSIEDIPEYLETIYLFVHPSFELVHICDDGKSFREPSLNYVKTLHPEVPTSSYQRIPQIVYEDPDRFKSKVRILEEFGAISTTEANIVAHSVDEFHQQPRRKLPDGCLRSIQDKPEETLSLTILCNQPGILCGMYSLL